MDYIELKCLIEPFDTTIREILMAELSELGYESFVEEQNYLLAYIQQNQFNKDSIDSIGILSSSDFRIELNHKLIAQQNWNETWEKNYFEPIIIEDQCVIRSTFHPEFPNIKYQITIDPKMSFGTGHHETTSLMIKEILQLDLEGKNILDMGCGTGILAILSSLRGAKEILAVDIDEWSYNNSIENIQLNGTQNIKVKHGDIQVIENEKYDIIFANINKNVLLKDIPQYVKNLHRGAYLLLSGFYESDFHDINNLAIENELELVKKDDKNKWLMLKYLNK